MKIKVLHIVGGSMSNGAFIGSKILHNALINHNLDSKILSDAFFKKEINEKNKDKIIFINQKFYTRFLNMLFVIFEKIIKSIFLSSPRDTFNICVFGFDLTKFKEYKDADIIHIHWLNQGFIKLRSLSKINKPVVWTMRDMWAFNGGPHYTMDFKDYEKTFLSELLKKYKKKNYNHNFNFVAVSKWLMNEAQKSNVLKNFNIIHIPNNINKDDFEIIEKNIARKYLNIYTEKQIICYGSQNPQSKRKGWNIFVESLKVLDKSKYFLLIFGNFWSHDTLKKIGIEFKSVGYVENKKDLSNIYSCADFFVAPSIQDAWPKTFAEAMLCRTPVICFNNTSISEIIEHKIDGFIVDKHNPNELKKGIDWMSDEVKNSNMIGNKARIKIQNYDANLICQKYINLYRKLLKIS